MNDKLRIKILTVFKNKENHMKVIEFLLDSDISTFFKTQSSEIQNEICVILEEYHQMKLKENK